MILWSGLRVIAIPNHNIEEIKRLALYLQNMPYKANFYTRIDSFQLCETEHFLNWGVLRYSKSGLVALRGEYCGTDGKLRYLGSPTYDDFTASSNIVKEYLCGFFVRQNDI